MLRGALSSSPRPSLKEIPESPESVESAEEALGAIKLPLPRRRSSPLPQVRAGVQLGEMRQMSAPAEEGSCSGLVIATSAVSSTVCLGGLKNFGAPNHRKSCPALRTPLSPTLEAVEAPRSVPCEMLVPLSGTPWLRNETPCAKTSNPGGVLRPSSKPRPPTFGQPEALEASPCSTCWPDGRRHSIGAPPPRASSPHAPDVDCLKTSSKRNSFSSTCAPSGPPSRRASWSADRSSCAAEEQRNIFAPTHPPSGPPSRRASWGGDRRPCAVEEQRRPVTIDVLATGSISSRRSGATGGSPSTPDVSALTAAACISPACRRLTFPQSGPQVKQRATFPSVARVNFVTRQTGWVPAGLL